MSSKNGSFVIGVTAVLIALVWSYSAFTRYFGVRDDDYYRARQLEARLKNESFAREVAEARLRDFAQDVAAVLPAESQKRMTASFDKVSALGQVVREPAAVKIDLSGVRMEKAKALFRKEKFADAMKEFEGVVELYPASPNSVEALFLLAESAFLAKDDRKVIGTVDFMVSQFPQNDYTGFALLRLGQVSERNSQFDEALEIYRTVARTFKNSQIRQSANELAKELETR